MGLAPEIAVNLDNQTTITYYNILAGEEIVTKQLDAYAARLGENKVVDVAEEKDTIRGNFVQLTEDGSELEGGIKAEQVIIAIDMMKDEEVKASFLGAKAGDVIVFDPVKAYDNKHEVGHMLNISHEEAEKLSGNFSFTVVEVLHFEKAEVNQDLFTKIYGEESGIATKEEFKARIKAEIEENFVQSSDYKFAIDSRDALLKEIQFELPEAFLKRWIKATNEKMTDEQIESDFDNFMIDLKWQLIKERIVKDNDLKINEEDVRALAKEMAAAQFRQYGLNNVSDEHLENYAEHMLKNEEERRKLVSRKQEDVIVAAIKDKVTLDNQEISYEAFNKMLEN